MTQIKNRLWGKRERTEQTFYKTRRTVGYPCFPKLHLICSRWWTAHEDTKLWWKMPDQPDFNHFLGSSPKPYPKMFIFLFQPLLSKFEPDFPVFQGIPAGHSKRSRRLEKCFWKWIWNSAGKFSCPLMPLLASEIRSPLLTRLYILCWHFK